MFRVKDWDRLFERAQTRGYDKIRWVPIPNKHDGDGYTQLIDHANGAAHYGAWCVLVQVASKCKPRGTLVRETSTPHDAESLARVTRIPAPIFREAIPRFVEIGWLEEVTDSVLIACQQSPAEQLHQNGTERNGKEQNVPFVRSCETDQTEVWEESRRFAAEIKAKLWPARHTPLAERDRTMLLKVAYLTKMVFTEEWLGNAVEGTRLKNARRPAAYFKTILAETSKKLGHNLNELLDSITIPMLPTLNVPAEFLTRRKT
jgi:hypothetical protein